MQKPVICLVFNSSNLVTVLSCIFTHVQVPCFNFPPRVHRALSCAAPAYGNFNDTKLSHHFHTAQHKTKELRPQKQEIRASIKMQKQEVRRGEGKNSDENAEKGIGQRKKEQQEEKNNERERGGQGKEEENPPPLMALNHVSRLCRNVKDSIEFYTKMLGFVLIERPQALDFEGAWLFNYGVGIHLVQSEEEERLPSDTEELDPQDNHISFQCEDMEAMEKKLKEMNVKYMKRTLEAEDGKAMDQLFFNDPDGFMVEICNCENLKLVPAGSLGKIKLPMDRHTPPVETNQNDRDAAK